MSQSVSGTLRNWTKQDWERATTFMFKDGGGAYTPEELKAEFLDLQSKGVELIPVGKCDNFDSKNGCLGHEEEKKDGGGPCQAN